MTDTIWHPNLDKEGPKYAAVARAIMSGIRSGALAQGAKLPPVRDLAFRIGVTPGTVARAYKDLTEEGVLEATVGRGTFVAKGRRGEQAEESRRLFLDLPQGHVDLRSSDAPDVGQEAMIATCLADFYTRQSVRIRRYSGRPDDEVLEAMCSWIGEQDVGPLLPRDVVMVGGAQSGLLVILQTLMADRPRVVLTDELAYAGFRQVAGLVGARVDSVAMDRDGLIPEALEAACRRHGPAVLATSSEVSNPTTRRTSVTRRDKIVEIARAYGMMIIDDWTYALENSEAGYRARAPERSWHVVSLSKIIGPGLRLGAIAAPEGWATRALVTFQNQCYGLPRVSMDLCGELLKSGMAHEIRRRTAETTDRRVAIARDCLAGLEMESRLGVPFVWLTLPAGWRASTFKSKVESMGIEIRAADTYALSGAKVPNAVRFSLNGVSSDAELEGALTRIAETLRHPPADLDV